MCTLFVSAEQKGHACTKDLYGTYGCFVILFHEDQYYAFGERITDKYYKYTALLLQDWDSWSFRESDFWSCHKKGANKGVVSSNKFRCKCQGWSIKEVHSGEGVSLALTKRSLDYIEAQGEQQLQFLSLDSESTVRSRTWIQDEAHRKTI